MYSSRVGVHSVRISNHWAWSNGLGLLVRFLGHKRNTEQDSYT